MVQRSASVYSATWRVSSGLTVSRGIDQRNFTVRSEPVSIADHRSRYIVRVRKILVLGGFLTAVAALRACRRAGVYSLRATERTALRRSSGQDDGSAAGMARSPWVPRAGATDDWRLWEVELAAEPLEQGNPSQ